MKRKRIRYEAVHPNPDREDKNTVHSTSPSQHSSGSADVPRTPGPVAPCRAAVAHRKDAPAIRHSSRGLKRLTLEAAGTDDSKETALEYFKQDMHGQSSGGPRQSLLKSWICPSQCVVRTRRRR